MDGSMEMSNGDGGHHSSSPESPGARPSATKREGREKSEREKRTYRACLHCRQRKSRCDLYSSGEPGRPPCERCIREQHECILGGSRRGGRRVKRSTSDAANANTQPQNQVPSIDSVIRPVPLPHLRTDQHDPHTRQQCLPSWSALNPDSRILPPLSQQDGPATPTAKMTVDETVASTDLQNPADALEFLANVAERDSGSNQLPPMHSSVYGRPSSRLNVPGLDGSRPSNQPTPNNVIDYPPLTKGQLSLEMLQALLYRYEDKYHPFFPLANPAAMDPSNLPTIAAQEPHLLAAILTVASKDEKDWWQVHDDCSTHMQSLVASLVYSGSGSVEAVEAMLILAEWVPRRPHNTPSIGRGEEDQAAWMYVGTAIRLGYLLGIDRTGFRAESGSQTADLNRKRLAWASCYMSDRQISVRIGKAFWSRGPGPMTALRAQDFPSLYPRLHRHDDFAAIYQANLELTQLFSNAHDVLYATKSRSNQLNYGGEYVKYIDDFRVALRHWNDQWGVFTCSPPLKASLILSYEYLRLYVNAFAYQATLNRLINQMKEAIDNGEKPRGPAYPFADMAATPDARFIYDAIDAAKALLSTFCSFVDPQDTFRFMPLRYYLYVIYSAVFLYKARSTGVMGGDTRGSVKRLISDTMDNLQKSSACPNDVGERYSRLIKLLWRKAPSRGSIAVPNEMPRPGTAQLSQPNDQGMPNRGEPNPTEIPPPSINQFSWLDLGAVGDFAVENNNSIAGSMMDNLDRFEDSSADGFSQFDPSLMVSPQQFPWNGLSPNGIIF
ncbi:Transcriptional activator ARO80 [Fulvia fulva]|nr:Transcriptional activator ARO80 [Fulvia fulva]KAK4614760.1 Transcriptional activator ARO80 [Fulvia fulva]WPV20144.1 Transcriptional activator ARO80 [Fulvia fulva]WPV35337.1 Transcriptional activator ARO80 [Fulvia fulva]